MRLHDLKVQTRIVLVALTLVCLSVVHSLAYASQSCGDVLKPKSLPFSTPVQSQAAIKLRGMTYNMKNVFVSSDNFLSSKGMGRMSARNQGSGEKDKPESELHSIRMTLKEYDPDFIVGQEIENVKAAREILDADPSLKDRYHVFLKEGNDERGIDVGFFVKKSLPFKYKLESHKHLTWTDRWMEKGHEQSETMPLFSRDFPVLIFFSRDAKEGDKPVLILGGLHSKSKRHRPGDEESRRWRTAQHNGIAKITQEYRERYGDDVPFMIAGDFNTEVQTSKELEGIRAVGLESAFDKAEMDKIPPEDRGTHAFFPKGGKPKFNQLDDMRIRNIRVIRTEIADYKDQKGRETEWPNSYKERERQGSDHKAIIADIEVPSTTSSQ